MSPVLNIFSEQVTLALGAYARGLVAGIKPDDYKGKLQDAGMTEAQASIFISRWEVVDQYNHSELVDTLDGAGNIVQEAQSNGASATLFRDKSNGTVYLAVRGTESSIADFTSDGILALGFPPELNPQYQSLKLAVQGWLDSGKLSAPQAYSH